MTPSKDTLETASPAASVSVTPSAAAKADVGRMRADAVSLDVPIRVHGSRVTEVVRGATPHTEPFEEETTTMIVFPQGGVLRMATAVSVGQMLVVTNQRTKQDAICRVLKVRAYSNTQAYVEIEFTHRQSGYWGVQFADDDSSSASAAPSTATDRAEKKRPDTPIVSSMQVKLEPIAKPPAAPAAKNASSFVSIGSQEDVQLPATVTEARPRPAPVAPPVRAAAPVAPPPAERVVPEHEEEAAPSRSFGSLTGGSTFGNLDSRKTPDFGSLESTSSASASASAPRNGNWMWIAACGAFLVVGLTGGALYFRQHAPAAPQQVAQLAQTPNADTSHQVEQGLMPSAVVSAQPTTPAAAVAAPVAPPAPVAAAPTVESNASSNSSRPSRPAASTPAVTPANSNPAPSRPEPTPAREARSAPMGNIGMATIDAHPVAKRGGANADAAAPTLPASAPAAPSLSLSNMLGGSTPGVPAGVPTPSQVATPSGGSLIAPRLTRSVPPVYPMTARRMGIAGNVVLEAQVDKAGNVSGVKVLSGPEQLQSAAISAVKDWKYQPGTLDGSPIPAKVTVTIKFQP